MRAGLGEQTLEAAATGTAIGMVIALVLSAWVIYRAVRGFHPRRDLAPSRLCGGRRVRDGAAVPHGSPFMALVALALGFASAVATLVITRELTNDDWHALRRVVRRD